MAAIHRIGFTKVSDGSPTEYCSANIIFIHGLKGHPRKTWGPPRLPKQAAVSGQPSESRWKNVQSLFQLKASASDTSSVRSETSSTAEKLFWPAEFLAEDIPEAKIWTYGYNADVLAGMFQMNSKNSISQHGADFSARIEREIDNEGHLIFVTHSLGGIVLKDALHRSKICRQRTKLILFLGTPHRGSALAGWGEIASNLARLTGQDPNSKAIKTLNVNSEVLDNIHEEFKTIVHSQAIQIHTFQEARSMSGMKGINQKVVDDVSSKADLPRSMETVESIDADHMQMVKCGSKSDTSYRAIRGVIKKFTRTGLNAQTPNKPEALAANEPENVVATEANPPSHISHNPAALQHEHINEVQPAGAPEPDGPNILSGQLPKVGGRRQFLVPYTKNPDFIGRSKIISQLRHQFGHGTDTDKRSIRPRVALYGLGGVGKTQIALSYVYWLREFDPHVSIFWVHAASIDRFRHSYSTISRVCSIEPDEDSDCGLLELVKLWLEHECKSPWFLVIDNADDEDLFFRTSPPSTSRQVAESITDEQLLGQYIPQSEWGHVLITTRSKALGVKLAPGKPPVEVEQMDESEADALVQAILADRTVSPDESTALAARLEFLPLCIAQAASFILENTISISDYIELLEEGDQVLVEQLSEPFEAIGRDSDTPHAVTATWIISFEQIRRQCGLAADVLSFISLLNRQAIPKTFVLEYYKETRGKVGPKEKLEITKALGTLKSFSFITEAKDHHMSMHRLVQLVSRKWLVSEDRLNDFALEAVFIMSVKYPYGDDDTVEVCEKYLPHAQEVLKYGDSSVEDVVRSRSMLLHNMSTYYVHIHQPATAEKAALEAIELGEQVPTWHGDEDQFARLSSLAIIYLALGKLDEAEKINLRVLNTTLNKYGQDHRQFLSSQAFLARTYEDQKRFAEAEALFLNVLERSKKLFGENDLDTLDCMSSLAGLYGGTKRHAEAIEMLTVILGHYKKELGPAQHETLQIMTRLSLQFRTMGMNEDHLRMEVEAFEGSKVTLGEKHPTTLERMGRIASAYWIMSRYEECEPLQLKHLEYMKEKYGADHPDTESSLWGLANLYLWQGRLDEGEAILVSQLERRKKTMGMHRRTFATMESLAEARRRQGKLDEAVSLMEECLTGRKQVLGLDHEVTESTRITLEKFRREASGEDEEGAESDAIGEGEQEQEGEGKEDDEEEHEGDEGDEQALMEEQGKERNTAASPTIWVDLDSKCSQPAIS